MRWTALLCFVPALLAACASAPPAAVVDVRRHLHDEAFAPPTQRVSPDDVFALSDEMRAFIAGKAGVGLRFGDPRRELVDMLYRKQKLQLEYDASTTRTAAEAYAARAGNCLSLVIMTAAFAKAMGLPVYYQRVFVDDAWSRSGDLYVASRHVNLALEWPAVASPYTQTLEPTLVVDFLPPSELRGMRSQPIGEATILAMFMNNRAAETLVAGRVDDAYWWAREAALLDPTFNAGLNTLGVIYERHGMPEAAAALFDDVLQREPDNTKVLGNLVGVLHRLGRESEAAAAAARLAQIEPTPPFHWFNLGLDAMRDRHYELAREMFQRELRREAYYHEFHFWLAQAELALGHAAEARAQLELARQSSTTPRQQSLYAAKLDRLKATRTQ